MAWRPGAALVVSILHRPIPVLLLGHHTHTNPPTHPPPPYRTPPPAPLPVAQTCRPHTRLPGLRPSLTPKRPHHPIHLPPQRLPLLKCTMPVSAHCPAGASAPPRASALHTSLGLWRLTRLYTWTPGPCRPTRRTFPRRRSTSRHTRRPAVSATAKITDKTKGPCRSGHLRKAGPRMGVRQVWVWA